MKRSLILLLLTGAMLLFYRKAVSHPAEHTPPQSLGTASLRFEPAPRRAGSDVKFIGRGPGYHVLFSPTEMLFRSNQSRRTATQPFRLRLVGANPDASIQGLGELPTTVNYLQTRDVKQWELDTPTFARIRYQEVYKGLDLVFYGKDHQLEYDFVMKPGANPEAITLEFDGIEQMEVTPEGDLVIQTSLGELRHTRPVVYQPKGRSKHFINGGYVRKSANQVGFRIDSYDRSLPVVIDPVLVFSTYLGGSGVELGMGAATDRDGNTYVTGTRPSARGTDSDIFVAKYGPQGALIWITNIGDVCDDDGRYVTVDGAGNVYVTGQLGFNCWETKLQPGAFAAKLDSSGRGIYLFPFSGDFSGSDVGQAIAVDAKGAAYVTGVTSTAYFPVTARAFQRYVSGVPDGFAVKIDPTGKFLEYATYLGGTGYESANGIVVDSRGNAYITGSTASRDFPATQGSFQPFNRAIGIAATNGFIAKLNADGSALVYSTFLGGTSEDIIQGIALDTVGNVYVTGETESDDFPTTRGSLQPVPADDRNCFYRLCTDAFVAKLNSTGSALIYSTYLGAELWEGGNRIAIDGSGNAYVTGYTNSTRFPVRSAVQTRLKGHQDGFVAKLNAAGNGLLFSTYMGGSDNDYGIGIAVDRFGQTHIAGLTYSSDFPTFRPQQRNSGGGRCWYDTSPCGDAFVLTLGQ